MPFSHHSHSGQFCAEHAHNTLEEMVQTAIAKKLLVFGCTEHMPRHEQDFYPGEAELGFSLERHFENQHRFFLEASRLRDKYKTSIKILIGFETDWIRPESLGLIQRTLEQNRFDYFVGSVHHVHTLPIDYDQSSFLRARQIAGDSEEQLFADYFDAQYAMLQAIKPPVVGHFDLIRLLSENANGSFRHLKTVWPRIERNLDFIVSYGGLLELNTSSLRKGMNEPYPKGEICKAFLGRRGRFCLSDDSHGIDQVALNYELLGTFLRKAGIPVLHFLEQRNSKSPDGLDARFPDTCVGHVEVAAVEVFLIAPDSIETS